MADLLLEHGDEGVWARAVGERWRLALAQAFADGAVDLDVASKIARQEPEVGMPMLPIELMHGEPDHVAEKVLKTKTRHTWTYYTPTGRKEIQMRFKFVNGELEGWEIR